MCFCCKPSAACCWHLLGDGWADEMHGMQIAYCEEQVECRRSVILAHFGESFDVKACHGTCDVCATRHGQLFEQVPQHFNNADSPSF